MYNEEIEHFKKNLYFFNWLNHTETSCSVCGVSALLTTAFFDKYIPIWLCDNCSKNLLSEVVQ